MIDPDSLVRGVLGGVLGGKRKRSKKALKYLTGRGGGMLSNPNTLLTVAGVAWGIFETMQNQGMGHGGGFGAGAPAGSPGHAGAAPPGSAPLGSAPIGSTPGASTPLPPLPNVAGAAVPRDALTMIRLAIAAASADGTFSDADREAIVERARGAGAEHLVEYELQNRRPLAEIVAGIADPAQRATLYVLAFGLIRADESVSGAERIFLAQLAHQLGLDAAFVSKLEADAAARIDAQE